VVAAAANGVACPRCRRTETTPLAREGDLQRRQCVACSENFTTPYVEPKILIAETPAKPIATGIAHAQIAPPDPSDIPMTVAGTAGRCGKCGKPYLRLGARYEAHVATCPGIPYVEPKRRQPKAVSPLPPSPTQVYEQSILALRARRAALEAEIAGIDGAILSIEKMKGAGGAAHVPFSDGSGAKPCSP
jgi:hypothetical protein